MGQGNYDHPSYITRQQICLGKTTAGANGTSLITALSPVSNMRVRAVSATVITAGTSAGAGNCAIILNGTTSIGQINLGTSAAGTVVASSDLNTTISSGTALAIKNGTDATGVCQVTVEAHLDPSTTWTGNG